MQNFCVDSKIIFLCVSVTSLSKKVTLQFQGGLRRGGGTQKEA